ncbi:alternative oxidase [Piscinibacter sp.]|uniref:alternative oxidase n=1 Tax=Piscinibacter sp. TaxID=1903157 RepID=UPI002CCC9C11|nr:alternative oxidase [Albitalea sp.]HUG21917.1 alternative oxidase [Albitalea sp.]
MFSPCSQCLCVLCVDKSSTCCHRVVGYFEEEAVQSYTDYLALIDAGVHANVAAPEIAKNYWKLPAGATLRDVVLAVREDEAGHRDVNHGFADDLAGIDLHLASGECPPRHQFDSNRFIQSSRTTGRRSGC